MLYMVGSIFRLATHFGSSFGEFQTLTVTLSHDVVPATDTKHTKSKSEPLLSRGNLAQTRIMIISSMSFILQNNIKAQFPLNVCIA